MPDISMCNTGDCAAAKMCYRHPDSGTKPSSHWQAWTAFTPDQKRGQCDDYWPIVLTKTKRPATFSKITIDKRTE